MKNLPQEANSTWRLILSSIFYGLSTIFSAMFGLGSKCFLPLIQKQRRQLCRKKLRKIKHNRKTTRKKQLVLSAIYRTIVHILRMWYVFTEAHIRIIIVNLSYLILEGISNASFEKVKEKKLIKQKNGEK